MATAYGTDFEGGRTSGSRVRWAALFAGLVAGIVTQVLLTLLGLAIGFNAIDPANAGNENFGGVGIGSGFWLILSSMIATFAGAWVASSLAGVNNRMDGMLHGGLTWGLMLITGLLVLGSSLSMLFGGAINLASSAVTGASQGTAISATRQEEGVAMVRERIDNLVGSQQATPTEGQATEGEGRPTEEAADTAAGVAWLAFFTAILSLAAGAFGGITGMRKPGLRAV